MSKEWVIGLYVVSTLLELIGIVVTFRDIAEANRSLSEYQRRGRKLFISAIGSARSGGSAELSGGAQISLEQRVQQLETTIGKMDATLDRREGLLREEFAGQLSRALKDVELTIGDEIEGLKEFAKGPAHGWFRRYVGPAVILVGIVVSGVASIASLYAQ